MLKNLCMAHAFDSESQAFFLNLQAVVHMKLKKSVRAAHKHVHQQDAENALQRALELCNKDLEVLNPTRISTVKSYISYLKEGIADEEDNEDTQAAKTAKIKQIGGHFYAKAKRTKEEIYVNLSEDK